MKPKTTLLLLVVLGLLCAVYWFAGSLERGAERRQMEAMQLFDFKPGAVHRLEVQQVGGPLVVADRVDAETWDILEPHPDIKPLNELWNRVAKHLSEVRNNRTIAKAGEADLADYGLDAPVVTVRAVVDGGDEHVVRAGKTDPTEQWRYAQVDGGDVFLLERAQFHELNRSADDLRMRFLVDNREANIVRVEFARIYQGDADDRFEVPPAVGEPSVAVVVERDGPDAPWRMVAPIGAPADQDLVDAFVKEVQFAMGSNYIDAPENLADYGLSPAKFQVTLYDDDGGEPQTIWYGSVDTLGSKKGDVFTMRDDRNDVFTTSGHVFSLFPPGPLGWRDVHLLTERRKPVTRVEYRSQDTQFILEFDGDVGWHVADPPMEESDQIAISSYIASILNVTASKFPEGAPEDFGLDAPELSLAISLEGEDSPRVIHLAPDMEDAEYFVATQDSGQVVKVHENMANRLFRQPADFRNKALMRFRKEAAVMLRFTLHGESYVLEKHHGTWTVSEPAGHRLTNQSDAHTLLDLASGLRAVRAVPENSAPTDAEAGLDAPVLRLEVLMRSPVDPEVQAALGPLEVGALVPEDVSLRYARMAGRPGIFHVSQDLLDSFREAVMGVVPDRASEGS